MIFIGILLSIAAIGLFCWLLFTLAVFALPLFAGVTAGLWAYDTGAGWLGALLVGAVAAGLTFGIGQFLLGSVRPLWARILIAVAFVAPAAIAGYHATHGIVKHTMPSEGWQVAFSIIGAVAVGVTALMRLVAMTPPQSPGKGLVRSWTLPCMVGLDRTVAPVATPDLHRANGRSVGTTAVLDRSWRKASRSDGQLGLFLLD